MKLKNSTSKIRVILLISIIIFLQSCIVNKGDILVKDTKIEFDNLSKNDLSSIGFEIDKTELIPLETDSACLIDGVKKIIPSEGYFYIQTNSSVLKFSEEGKFICKFGARGNGPSEFNIIDTFCLQRDSIYLFDCNSEKVLVFDKNGNFGRNINEVPDIKFAVDAIALGKETILIAKGINFADDDCLYGVWNPDYPQKLENILSTTLTSQGCYSYSPHPIAMDGEAALFFAPFGNKIYALTQPKNEVETDFEISSVGYEDQNANDYSQVLAAALGSGNQLILSLFNTDRYLLVNLYTGSIVWDKTQEKGTYLSTGEYQPEDSEAPFYPLLTNYSSGNQILSVRAASEFADTKDTRLKASALTDSSNPVIVRYTLKK